MSNFISSTKIIEVTNRLTIDLRTREWCRLPYPGHPRGCPNYNQRATCPPEAPLISNFLRLDKPLWLIAIPFNLAYHTEKMRAKHPNWTDRQLRCVLYWQGTVNKQLRDATRLFMASHLGTIYTLCPEAMGVQLIRTAKQHGLPIKPRPTDLVFKISLVGYPTIGTAQILQGESIPYERHSN